MQKSTFEFNVLIHGSPAKEYYHKGSYYIEGKKGSRFSLRMRNNSNSRVLFVPTVDGLSIMSGKEASYKSRGYIVEAYDSLTISGWRTSDDNVAEFFFAESKNSYAHKIKTDGNLGVIGCAVFKEKKPIQEKYTIIEKHINCPFDYFLSPHFSQGIDDNFPTGNTGSVFCCSSSVSGSSSNLSTTSASLNSENKSLNLSSSLGTGFGQDKYSPVVTVEFDKEDLPCEVFSIFYNTKENLEKLGIEFKKPVYVTPSAFPKEDGYCQRP